MEAIGQSVKQACTQASKHIYLIVQLCKLRQSHEIVHKEGRERERKKQAMEERNETTKEGRNE